MTLSTLTKTLLAAGTLTVLAAAPAAYAADSASTKVSNNTFATHVDGRPDRLRGDRIRGERRNRRNFDRRHDNHDGHDHHDDFDHHAEHDRRDFRNNRRNARRFGNRFNRRFNNRFNSRDGFRNRSRFNNRLSYNTRRFSPYRSNLGISFNFGTPRYSGYRWARTPYSLYNSSFGSYSGYQNATVCRRVNRIAYHHGHEELVSVKECSNPYSGTYIVQGSERIIDCRY